MRPKISPMMTTTIAIQMASRRFFTYARSCKVRLVVGSTGGYCEVESTGCEYSVDEPCAVEAIARYNLEEE